MDTILMMQATLVADGSDVHQVANMVAGYRTAHDLGEAELFNEAETALRAFVVRKRLGLLK